MKYLFIIITSLFIVACGVKTKSKNNNGGSSISTLSNCSDTEVCNVNIDNLNPLMVSFPISANESGSYGLKVCNSSGSCSQEIAVITCSSGSCNQASIGSASTSGTTVSYTRSGYITAQDSVRIYRK